MLLPALTAFPLVCIPAGTAVITQDEPLAGIYFLESGEVEVLKNGVSVAEIYEPGAVFGEMSWLLDIRPTATVRTRTDCTFRHVADAAALFHEHPEVTLHMAGILARRIDSLTRYVVEVKNQFRDRTDHLGIMDEVLDSLVHRHPRKIAPRADPGD